MKIFKLFYMAALVSMGMISCVDLDYVEITSDDEQWVYDNPVVGAANLLTSVYAHLPNGFDKNYEGGSGSTLAAATDEAETALSTASVHRFYNGGWSRNNPFSFTWDNSYSAIAEANNFLEKLDRIDLSGYVNNNNYEAMKNRFELFQYEARFLRAYFYFELVRAYGDVPFTLRSLTNAEANVMKRTPANEVMNWIVDEMNAIAEYLPITYTTELTPEVGRVTRIMCLALKARTLLYQASPLFNIDNDPERWLVAARANHDVVKYATKWGLSLDDYAKIWANGNGDGTEVIFANKQGMLNSWEKYNYPIGVENGQGGMCPTQTLVDAYEFNDATGETFGQRYADVTINVTKENAYQGLDPRFELTVARNGDRWPGYNNQPLETFEGGVNGAPIQNATPTGYYLKKYCDGNVNISTNYSTTTLHAWVLMRLGEFYLNYAEAAYHYYGDADSKGEFSLSPNDAVNVLRDREDVMMPHWSGNPQDWLERYERERLVELAFEDQRFWDVRRWKKGNELAQVQVASVKKSAAGEIIVTRVQKSRGWYDKYYFFPIPFTEINKNPNLTQNPGWDNDK